MKCAVCGHLSEAKYDLVHSPSLLLNFERLTCSKCLSNHAESEDSYRLFMSENSIDDLCPEVRQVVTIFRSGEYIPLADIVVQLEISPDEVVLEDPIKEEPDECDEALRRILEVQVRALANAQQSEARGPGPLSKRKPRGALQKWLGRFWAASPDAGRTNTQSITNGWLNQSDHRADIQSPQ